MQAKCKWSVPGRKMRILEVWKSFVFMEPACLWRIPNLRHNSSCLPILLLCCDARSHHSSRPCHHHPCPTYGPGRRPLRGRGVRSRRAATPDPESIPTAGAQAPGIRPFRRRIVRSLHASCSPDPFCNRTETLNPIGPPPRPDTAKVPRAVLAKTRAQARAKGAVQRSHQRHCRNETTQSLLGLSPNRSATCPGLQRSH